MASNFVEKGCLSYFRNCEPTSTDLGPFYPLISSLFYRYTNFPIKSLVYFQTFIHLFVCFIFTFYLKQNFRIKTQYTLMIFAFSLLNPLSIGWQRYILPDTFSLDISLIVLLLIHSYKITNHYKYLCFSSILINIGTLIRYDIYILLIPVIAIFIINNIPQLVTRKLFVKVFLLSLNLIIIASISLSFWAIRNIKLGLPPIRNSFFSTHQNINPEIISWIKAWTINTYDLPKGIYPYLRPIEKKNNFNRLDPPEWALNKELKRSIEEDPFFLKDKTIKLVTEKAKAIRSNYFVNTFNNFKRIIWIVFGPFYSGGLHLEKSNYYLKFGTIKLALIKFTNFAMRISLLIACFYIYSKNSISKMKLLNAALLFLFFDVAVCLYLGQLEQRYLNDSILYLQFSIIFEYLNNFIYKEQ